MSLVQNIKKLAKSQNITVKDLGLKLGIGVSAVYKWEESSPKIETLQKVADYFNVSIDQLTFGFNRSLFAAILSLLKNGRTLEQFSKDADIDTGELVGLIEGIKKQQPSIEIVEKLIADNPIPFMINSADIYLHAGYDVPERYENDFPYHTPMSLGKNELNDHEEELLRVFKTLSIKDKTILLSRAYELEEENKKSQ